MTRTENGVTMTNPFYRFPGGCCNCPNACCNVECVAQAQADPSQDERRN